MGVRETCNRGDTLLISLGLCILLLGFYYIQDREEANKCAMSYSRPAFLELGRDIEAHVDVIDSARERSVRDDVACGICDAMKTLRRDELAGGTERDIEADDKQKVEGETGRRESQTEKWWEYVESKYSVKLFMDMGELRWKNFISRSPGAKKKTSTR